MPAGDQWLAGQRTAWRQRPLQRRLVARAAAAQAGIYGNDAVEAMYPFTRKDGDGKH